VIAACIVCTAGGIIALRAHALHSLEVRSVRATGPPTLGRKQPRSHFHPGPLGAEAPWALSALPECLLQQSVWRAPDLAGLRAHFPSGAQPVPAGSVLQYRSCILKIRADDAIVTRGSDRFHIPPHSHFFFSGDKLILVRQSKGAELRTYQPSHLQ
jgi:hypothetical protein